MAVLPMTDLEKAMAAVQQAKRLIRKAQKDGKEIDGHLERCQDELTKLLDVLDAVDKNATVCTLTEVP